MKVLKGPLPKAKYAELRCIHSYQGNNLYRMRGYGFDLFMCDRCFSNLITLINHILLTVGKSEGFTFKEMGIHCNRCEQWKLGTFYIVRRTRLRKVTLLDKEGNEAETFALESGMPLTVNYCEDCFREMDRNKVFVATRRNIYIPEEVDDKVVTTLFEDRLQRTEQLLTLMPTQALQRIFQALSIEQKKEIVQLMAQTTPIMEATLE